MSDLRDTPLSLAAEITGHTQQALEQLHELTTYRLSSAAVNRHGPEFEDIRCLLTEGRNKMASLALALGKEIA